MTPSSSQGGSRPTASSEKTSALPTSGEETTTLSAEEPTQAQEKVTDADTAGTTTQKAGAAGSAKGSSRTSAKSGAAKGGSAKDSKGSSRTATGATKAQPVAEDAEEEHSLGTGRGSAARGSSRSPVKESAAPSSTEERRGPRRVRLTLARLDPFSVMKLSFLVAIAVGIATVVAVVLLWNLVEAIGLWNQIDQLGRDLNGGDPLPFMDFFSFSKMVSYGTVVAVVNVVIITALGTLFAFLYNLVAALLGGLKMTFTDQ